MNKTQFYLSSCMDAASKSPMSFTLGAILVKGGKIISTGHNHHRTHYDGAEVRTRGHRKPVSMHAEMHTIYNLTGMSPSFREQSASRAPVQCDPPLKGFNQPKGTEAYRFAFAITEGKRHVQGKGQRHGHT